MIFFNKNFIRPLPKALSIAERLFDKNVLPIKKLANDIGDLSKIIDKERKLFFCMMTAALSPIRFLQKLIRKYNLTD